MRRLVGFGLVALIGLGAGSASAEQSTQTNQRTAIFRNVSGSTLTSGSVVIFDFNASGRDADCGNPGCRADYGFFVETTTSADSTACAGVLLDDSCLDGQDCVFVTNGPAYTRWAGLSDNTNSLGAAVGTTTVAGQAGSGTGLGIVLTTSLTEAGGEVNGRADNERRWVWVNCPNAN